MIQASKQFNIEIMTNKFSCNHGSSSLCVLFLPGKYPIDFNKRREAEVLPEGFGLQ